MTERTRQQALAALDGMREVVRHEMLICGMYVSDYIDNPALARRGAACGGRKHCAIGSLWAGAGVKFDPATGEYPGTDQEDRDGFLRRRPGLRLAYDSLNAAAEAFADANIGRVTLDEFFSAPIEGLFEGSYDDEDPNGGDLTKRDLLKIIAAARRRVKSAA